MTPQAALLHAALPQTQCTRCGYPDCADYAQAIAQGEAQINQCPPGGAEGIVRLARITGRAVIAASRCTPSAPPGGHWLMAASPEAMAFAYPSQSG